jgi:hypothetical protein
LRRRRQKAAAAVWPARLVGATGQRAVSLYRRCDLDPDRRRGRAVFRERGCGDVGGLVHGAVDILGHRSQRRPDLGRALRAGGTAFDVRDDGAALGRIENPQLESDQGPGFDASHQGDLLSMLVAAAALAIAGIAKIASLIRRCPPSYPPRRQRLADLAAASRPAIPHRSAVAPAPARHLPIAIRGGAGRGGRGSAG